jgi:hypothetical protein
MGQKPDFAGTRASACLRELIQEDIAERVLLEARRPVLIVPAIRVSSEKTGSSVDSQKPLAKTSIFGGDGDNGANK